MIEIKRDENGKRHFYVSTWLYIALAAIVGGLYGLIAIGLTSVIPTKVVFVAMGAWGVGYLGTDIVRKVRKARKTRASDELARSMFAGQIGRMWQTYAKVAHEDNPFLLLTADEFRLFAMDRYELDIRA